MVGPQFVKTVFKARTWDDRNRSETFTPADLNSAVGKGLFNFPALLPKQPQGGEADEKNCVSDYGNPAGGRTFGLWL
jgi:hypothetical protein